MSRSLAERDRRACALTNMKYLEKYLTKDREPCLKRWRLWAAFGNEDRSQVKDIELDSLWARIYKKCKILFGWEGNRQFNGRMQIVEVLYRETFRDWIPANLKNLDSWTSILTRADIAMVWMAPVTILTQAILIYVSRIYALARTQVVNRRFLSCFGWDTWMRSLECSGLSPSVFQSGLTTSKHPLLIH